MRALSLTLALVVGLVLIVAFGGSNDESKWLKAAQHMLIVNHDPLISTPEIDRVKVFIEWAVDNGYKVEVSRHDDVAGVNTNMYFMVVKKL